MSWTTQLSKEFHELLAVLTRLVALEEEQANLLDQITNSDLISRDDLAERGVRWPDSPKHRKPRLSMDPQLPE